MNKTNFEGDLLDEDGFYPSDSLLEFLESQPYKSIDWGVQARQRLELMVSAWKYDDWAKEVKPGLFVFATGGWSGNEELLSSFKKSLSSILDTRRLSIPGGLHIFGLEEAREDMEEIYEYITKWAWEKGRESGVSG